MAMSNPSAPAAQFTAGEVAETLSVAHMYDMRAAFNAAASCASSLNYDYTCLDDHADSPVYWLLLANKYQVRCNCW